MAGISSSIAGAISPNSSATVPLRDRNRRLLEAQDIARRDASDRAGQQWRERPRPLVSQGARVTPPPAHPPTPCSVWADTLPALSTGSDCAPDALAARPHPLAAMVRLALSASPPPPLGASAPAGPSDATAATARAVITGPLAMNRAAKRSGWPCLTMASPAPAPPSVATPAGPRMTVPAIAKLRVEMPRRSRRRRGVPP